MSDDLRSKKVSRTVSNFFLNILEAYDEPIYYDRLRGYASSSTAEVKAYVKKYCRGEELLTFFKRRSVIFNVTRHDYVEIKGKDNKRRKVIFDDEDILSTKPSAELNQIKSQRKKIPKTSSSLPSLPNSGISFNKKIKNSLSSVNNSLWNLKASSNESIWGPADDEVQLETETLKHFKECFCSKSFTYSQLNYYSLPQNVKSYLKLKYTKDKIQRFLLDHCDIFSIDDDGYVTVIDVPDEYDDEKQKSVEDFDGVSEEKVKIVGAKQQLQHLTDIVDETSLANLCSIDGILGNEKLKRVSQPVENIKGDSLSDENANCAKYFSKQLIVSNGKEDSKQKPKECRKADMVIAKGNEYSHNWQLMNRKEYEGSDYQEVTGTSEETTILGIADSFLTLNSERSKASANNKNSNMIKTAQDLNKKPKNHDSSLFDHYEVHQPLTSFQCPVIDDLNDEQDFQLIKEFFAIQHFVNIMQCRKNSPILIERIRGHLNQAPKEAFDFIKAKFKGHRFKRFFTSYPKIFFVCKQEVKLANGYEVRFKKMEECAILQIKNYSDKIASSPSLPSNVLPSSIQMDKFSEDAVVVNKTFLDHNLLLPVIPIFSEDEVLTQLAISGAFSPKPVLDVYMPELPYYSEFTKLFDSYLPTVSFARSIIFGLGQSMSEKGKFYKLYNLPILNEANHLIHVGLSIKYSTNSTISDKFLKEANEDLSIMESNWFNDQITCINPINPNANNIAQSKVICIEALKDEKITINSAYIGNFQNECFLETIIEEEESEYVTNKLLNNAEANTSPTNNISKTDHLLHEHGIIKHEVESECPTINNNNVSELEPSSTVKVSNDAFQKNITENNDFYGNDDIWIETSNHVGGSFGKWNNNIDDLAANMGPAIQMPHSQCSTNIKGTRIIATIYDRDFEIIEQEEILEDFPTYFCRFICLYIVQELENNNNCNGVEGKIMEDLELPQMSDESLDESDTTLPLPGIVSHHNVWERNDDSKDRIINENYLKIDKSNEVKTKMGSLASSLDGNTVSDTDYFSFSPNDFTTLLDKDNEDEVLQEEKSLANASLFEIDDGSLKSIANDEIRNGYACDLETMDTLKFLLHEDDTAMPRDMVKESSSFVSKDRFKKDVMVSNDTTEKDIMVSTDTTEKDIMVSTDITEKDVITLWNPIEEDVTISKDPVKEDVIISKSAGGKNVILSKDTDEKDGITSFDPALQKDITIFEDLVEDNIITSKYGIEEHANISKNTFVKEAIISKDPFEQDVTTLKVLIEEDVIDSKDPIVEDATANYPVEVDDKNSSIGSQTSLNQSSDGVLTSDTEYHGLPPCFGSIFSFPISDDDDDDLPEAKKNQTNVMSNNISYAWPNCSKNFDETLKNYNRDLVNIHNKNSGFRLPVYQTISSPNNSQNCNVNSRNKNGGFFTNAFPSENKSDCQPLNSTGSSSEFVESGFASALSMSSQDKMETYLSDIVVSSLTHEKPLNTQDSRTNDITNSFLNDREASRKSTSQPFQIREAEHKSTHSTFQIEDATLPLNDSSSSSNDFTTVFYGYVILLTKDVCIAKSIENGLPIFCSRDFFKCYKHKTGLDACFSGLTIGDIVYCKVLTPSSETNIMTCCQFSNTDDVGGKNAPFICHNPHEVRSVAVQTRHAEIQCEPNADALVEVKDSGCQTISTGEILLTKCLFPTAL